MGRDRRFDGVRFTPVAEDLPNDHARALLEDRDGACGSA